MVGWIREIFWSRHKASRIAPEIMFIVLNLVDAKITQIYTDMELGVEGNMLLTVLGGNIIMKGLMAFGVVLVLRLASESEWMIKACNIGMLLVIIWNVYSIYAVIITEAINSLIGA